MFHPSPAAPAKPPPGLGRSDGVRHRCLCTIVATGLSLVLAACASVNRIPSEQRPPPLANPASTFAERGFIPVSVQSGTRAGEYGCTLSYETYRPVSHNATAMVMLAHGFLRGLERMRGWAEHWASHGVPVTVMSLCNSTWLNGHHDRNAEDLVILAGALHDGPVLYAGFSAGGLAAYLAASADPRTLAYLGLDAVDSGGLGVGAAGQFRVSALFLLAEPSACNANNNIWGVISAMERFRVLRIRNSTHCHFENPYDARCEWACGSTQPAGASDAVMDTIRSLATAWVLARVFDHPPAATMLEAAEAGSGAWKRRVEVLP